jgi:predicted CxxxxCH...CXXCH cytochrome family protein
VEWGAAIIQAHQNYVHANSTAGCANAACHGPNLIGGAGSAPSCTTCHVGGVITISKHPFAAPAVVNHKPFLANTVPANDTTSCALAACHGANLAGGVAGPSCSGCHLGGALAKHPASFGTTTSQVALNHKAYVDANTANGCKNTYCHGSSLDGAAPAIGPSCSSTVCHQIGIPTGQMAANCVSCHNRPPAGGIASPNRGGAHAKHDALTGVTSVCDTCHTGAGTGTLNHFNGVINAQPTATYNAKSGAAVRNPDGTCSNVSCHGGLTTPVWLTETIDVNTDCVKCHTVGTSAGTPENNSPYSGEHSFHATQAFGSGVGCTACHDTVTLAPNHFTTLNTTAMEGPASGTIGGALITSYSAGTCNAACHPGDRSWGP